MTIRAGFHFPHEFGKSDLTGLANCFAASKLETEEAAEAVIVDEWKAPTNGFWQSEPRRHQRGFDGQRRMRRGEGEIDSFADYLATHAVLTVGGRWLDTRPQRTSPYDEGDNLDHWLRRYLPTRDDGRWLSDIRDLPPEFRPSREPGADWRWSVARADLLSFLTAREIPVWGNFMQVTGDHFEDVTIRSALITRGNPLALLAAAQTTGEPWECPLPVAEDRDWEIDEPDLGLIGWIADPHFDRHADDADPWGSGLPYPVPGPASAVVQSLKLETADHGLRWTDRSGKPVFRAAQWTSELDRRSERQGAHGHLLYTPVGGLASRLRRLKADLILSVSVSRERRRYDGARERSEGEEEHADPYFIHVLVTRDGQIRSL